MLISKIQQEGKLQIKFLRDKSFNIETNPNYLGYQRDLASMGYKFFDKKSKGTSFKNEIKQNKKLGEELHNIIFRKF